jgi:hypothetical protein
MKRLLACTILAASLAAATPLGAQQSGSPQPIFRSFTPNPRSVIVRPSPVHSRAPVKHSQNVHGQVVHGQAFRGQNPYAQPYVNIDPATMKQLLATPAPQATHRAAPRPTPTVFWQINNRP